MELPVFILVSAICAASIYAGSALAFMAKEELKPGKRYFIIASTTAKFVLSVIIMREFFHSAIYMLVSAGVFTLIISNIRKQHATFNIVMAFILALSSSYDAFPYAASVIFLSGLLIGTLDSKAAIEQKRGIMGALGGLALRYAWFIPISIAFYFMLRI